MIVAVLCTGQSLTQADVDLCRKHCDKVVAVSDAFYMAPWADALVSYDKAWWKAHKPDYSGPKYHCHASEIEGMQMFEPRPGNSGTLGLSVAMKMKPSRVILLGADCQGTHFFGKHTKTGLRHTSATQFRTMTRQFAAFSKSPIVNCSPVSALTCFPKMSLEEALGDIFQRAAA